MLAPIPVPEERLARIQREMRRPEPVNVEPLLQLGNDLLLEFNGRLFRVPPMSHRHGVLQDMLWARIVAASERRSLEDLDNARTRFVAFLGQMVRPCGTWRLLAWRLGWRPNPFANATEKEVRALADFFVFRRTNQNVRLSFPER